MGEKRAATTGERQRKEEPRRFALACSFKLSASLFCSVSPRVLFYLSKKQTDAPWEDEGPRDAVGFLKKRRTRVVEAKKRKTCFLGREQTKSVSSERKANKSTSTVAFALALSLSPFERRPCPRARGRAGLTVQPRDKPPRQRLGLERLGAGRRRSGRRGRRRSSSSGSRRRRGLRTRRRAPAPRA